jgi:hypothetical protein
LIGVKGPGGGGGKDMLAQHIQRAGAARFSVQCAGLNGLQGGGAFDHLPAVCRHQKRLGGCVVAVIGAPDPLYEAFDILGRADLNDQIDIAPVDPQIERASADNRAQAACDHRGLDLFALLAREAAVMDADRQVPGVLQPKRVKEQFRLRAGIVENQRRAVAGDLFQYGWEGVMATAARPRRRGFGFQHSDIGVGAGVCLQQVAALGGKEAAKRGWVLDRG